MNVTLDESCEGTFLVNSSNVNDIYIFDLGNENSFPSCTSADWRKSLLQCNHMLSVVIKGVQGHHGILYPKSTDLLSSFNLTKK